MNNKKYIGPAILMMVGVAIVKSPDFLSVIFKWVENGNSNFIVYLSLVAWPIGGLIFLLGLAKLIRAIRKQKND